MRILIVLTGFIFLFFSFSCKKDKLEDGKEIFIGKWNWVYSNHEHYICIGLPQVEVLTPETEHRNYSMEFFERGIVKFYDNGNLASKERLVFDGFLEYTSDYINECFLFYYYLNNKINDDNFKMYGLINSDTIVFLRGFPFQDSEEGCEQHISYFVKE